MIQILKVVLYEVKTLNNLSLIDSEKLYEYIYQSISIYISPFSNLLP